MPSARTKAQRQSDFKTEREKRAIADRLVIEPPPSVCRNEQVGLLPVSRWTGGSSGRFLAGCLLGAGLIGGLIVDGEAEARDELFDLRFGDLVGVETDRGYAFGVGGGAGRDSLFFGEHG